jgi:hypothetical protein
MERQPARERDVLGLLVLDTPLLAERLLRFALHGRVTVREHEGRKLTHARANQAEILSRLEEARIPALPVRQQGFDTFA